MGFLIMNVGYLGYIVRYRPLYSQWRFEVFNEGCTLVLSLIALANFTEVPELKYYLCGYTFLGIFCFNIAINLSFILKETSRSIFL